VSRYLHLDIFRQYGRIPPISAWCCKQPAGCSRTNLNHHF